MQLVGRSFTAGNNYRYGFNGKENDNDVKGEGNQVDYGMRMYDPRLGRFLSLDPLQNKFPFSSPYTYVLNNPIINIDIDGEEVLWFQPLTTSMGFKKLIKNLNKNDVYLTVIKRFRNNQDNLFFKTTWLSGFYAITPLRGRDADNKTPNGADGYTVYISTSSLVSNNGDLLVDPTYAAKVLIHEAMHAKFHLIQDNKEITDHPTLQRNMNTQNNNPTFEGEHETMAEGNIPRLIEAMKQFDASSGSKHSNDWYESMAWRGSLMYHKTTQYQQLDAGKRKLLEQIATNEDAYETYLKAKSAYHNVKTNANKTAVKAAYNSVDWKLFKKTRR
jgi:RHS repeat-associated protein